MGELTDGMLDGTYCQQCMGLMPEVEDGGEPCGHPVTCGGCEHENRKKALKNPNLPASERQRMLEEERIMWDRIKRSGAGKRRK